MNRAQKAARSARRWALGCSVGAAAMVGAAYAAVPLYEAFCAAFGIGGAPRVARADVAPGAGQEGEAGEIIVRFDANLAAGLDWDFTPPAPIRVALGEATRVDYHARNFASAPTTGRAVFSVSPAQAAYYFVKTECFCFQEQTLAAGESVDMAVIFHVDPEIRKEVGLENLGALTLSYTFFPSARESAEATQPVR